MVGSQHSDLHFHGRPRKYQQYGFIRNFQKLFFEIALRLVNEKKQNISLYFRPETKVIVKDIMKKTFSVVSYKFILKLSAAEKQEIQFQFSKVHQAKPWENKFTQIKRLIQM